MGHARPASSAKVRRIVWTDEAANDLENIVSYITQFNPLAAQRMAARLIAAAEALKEHAERGRPVGEGHRQLAIVRPYLIRYRIDGDTVVVFRCWHGSRLQD